MYLSFNSSVLTSSQITDYLTRVVQPKLQTVDGVANAQILGGQTFAMRIWLDPEKMAALGVTPLQVRAALATNNFTTAAGQIKGDFVETTINAETSLASAEAFGQLVVTARGDALVRLGDIAEIALGAEDVNSTSAFDGLKAVFIGIYSTPTANPLTVIADVRKEFPSIEAELPPGMSAAIAYDSTKFIDASISEVQKTLIEAALIVIVVIFLFLGSLRSTLIPIVTIPLSLIGVMFALLALGYSINLLTLLALVLAIGLVVDDAIVVVENIHRHIEEGLSPFDAALVGAREISVPVISMTITLAAVYAPIGFVSGLTGSLFREFAFTLAGAVIVSGVIALTLSPMMCSKLLSSELHTGRFVKFLDRTFERLKHRYQRRLGRTLNYRPVTLLVLVGVIATTVLMYATAQKELAPEEDQGILFNLIKTPPAANIDYLEQVNDHLYDVFQHGAGEGACVRHQRHGRRRAPGVHRHPLQAVGGAQPHAGADTAGPAAEGELHRRWPDHHLRQSVAARLDRRPAHPVRHHHDGRLRAAGAGAGEDAGRGAEERPLHLQRRRPQVRHAADRGEDRPRQGEQPRHHHAGHRRLAGDAARRQLRQPLQPLRPQLSGDPAGAARLPADARLDHALRDQDVVGRHGAAVDRRRRALQRAAERLDELPAAQLGDAAGRAVPGPHRRRGHRLPEGEVDGDVPGDVHLRLPGREPAVRAGGQPPGRHLHLRADRHLSRARGAV